MTQDYTECKNFCKDRFGDEYGQCINSCNSFCYEINDCDYKLRIKVENQLQKSLEDNNALSKHIEYIEKKLKQALEYGE